MKCKLCGAVYDDDNIYFCIGCGAMLKNPATGEIVKDNREDDFPEYAVVPEEDNTADLPETDLVEVPEILPEPELRDDPVSEPEEEILPPPVIEDKEEVMFSSDEVEDISVREPINEAPKQETFMEKETKRTVVNNTVPPVQNVEQPVPPTPAVSVKTGFGQLFGATIVSFITVVLLIAVSLLFSLKLGFTGTNLHNIAERLDKWAVINVRFNDMTLADNLYYETDFDKASHGFADKNEFTLYLAGIDFIGFCADKLETYADYIIDGVGDEPTITENEIVDFFIANHDRGTEIFGYEMQTADYNAIRSSLAKKETAEKFSVGKIGWELKFRLESIGYLLSYVTIGILVALIIVLMIWVTVIVKHSGRHILGFFGNIFAWSGIAVLLAAVGVSAGTALGYAITGDFICYLSSTLLLPSAVYAACIGVILFIAGFIIKKVKNSIKVKEKIQKATGKMS